MTDDVILTSEPDKVSRMQRHMSTNLTHLPRPISHVHDGGDVDLWSVWVDGDVDHAAAFALLDQDERQRADRFRFRRDRDRFIARHAFARRVLARYVGADAAAVAIRTTAFGRPALDPVCGISFNTSHTDGLAIVAVTHGRRVGVDIERLRHLDDAVGIAEGYFTKREIELLESVPQASRSRVFLTLWTRKESFVKAVGGGLSVPLDSFDSSIVGDGGVGRPSGPLGDLPFAFVGLDVADGYIGAVTVDGTRVAVRRMDMGTVAA